MIGKSDLVSSHLFTIMLKFNAICAKCCNVDKGYTANRTVLALIMLVVCIYSMPRVEDINDVIKKRKFVDKHNVGTESCSHVTTLSLS